MRAIRTAVILLTLAALPLSLFAQGSMPPLVPDVRFRPDDSPLVRAAKIAVASRAGQPTRVFDNAAVANSRGVISTSSGAAELPTFQPTSMYPGAAPAAGQSTQTFAPQVDRAAVQKKIQQLNQEEGRMAMEAEQPYAGDVSEDRVDQRLSQIPQERQQLQQQLNQPQPTPPPPPPPNQY